MGGIASLFSRLTSSLDAWIETESVYPEPGFIDLSAIKWLPERLRLFPLLVTLRILIFISLLFRFLPQIQSQGSFWGVLQFSLLLAAGMIPLAWQATYNLPSNRARRRAQLRLIVSDLLLITVFYWFTGKSSSDIYLFYCLPLLTIAQYFGVSDMCGIFGLVAGVLIAAVLFLLTPIPLFFTIETLELVLLRSVFYPGILSFLTWRQLVRRRELGQRETEMQSLLDFRRDIASIFEVKRALELAVLKAVEVMADTSDGHAFLVDYETGETQFRFAMDPGLAARFDGDGRLREEGARILQDMVQRVVLEKTPHLIDDVQAGDEAWRELFGPRVQSLVWVPILAHDVVLGVLGLAGSKVGQFKSEVGRFRWEAGQFKLDESKLNFFEILAGQTANAIERARLLKAQILISGEMASTLELSRAMDELLLELTERLGFNYATVSLVDKYRQTIESVRGVHVPSGWIRRARYNLDAPDIMTDIVRSGKTEVIQGWDPRFNREIFERFDHKRLARIFVPLKIEGEVIGVVEASCAREHRKELLSKARVREIEELTRQRTSGIAQSQPYFLLELIAGHASKIIGADAASIHLYRSDEIILEAGAGKATPEFLRRFLPEFSSALETHSRIEGPIMAYHAPELQAYCPLAYTEGVRALAAYSLPLGTDLRAALYIHFYREHRFSPAEQELEAVFARLAQVVIQNHLLLQSLDDAAEKTRALSQLQNVIQSITSSLDAPRVLNEVAQNVLHALDADNVVLYQYEQEYQRFLPEPVTKGSFKARKYLRLPLESRSVAWDVVRKGESQFFARVADEPSLWESHGPRSAPKRFVQREQIVSAAHLVLRDDDTKDIVGLMFVNYRTEHHFDDPDEKKMLQALASSAAIAIRTARLHAQLGSDLRRRENEIVALHRVDELILGSAYSSGLEAILDQILQKSLEIIDAPIGYVAMYDLQEKSLSTPVLRGARRHLGSWYLGEGIVGQAAAAEHSILTREDQLGWREMQLVSQDSRSALAVPLMDGNVLLGVMCVEDPRVDGLDEDDRNFLERISLQAVIAVHSLRLYTEREKQSRPLRALGVLAPRIQYAQYELDTVLRMLLTGITAREGAGFSRAMLFLKSEDNNFLDGKMAIGGFTHAEAEAIWFNLDERMENVGEDPNAVLELLLDEVAAFSADILAHKQSDRALSLKVQELSLDLHETQSALVECLQTRRTILVSDLTPDPFRELIQPGGPLPEDEREFAFICMPLVGKGQNVIGVLVVDNRFLRTERDIDQDRLNSLGTFAGMLAMSIENANLQAQLVENERRMAWKQFTARVAHILGSSVSLIETDFSWLRRHLEAKMELLSPEIKRRLAGLAEEIREAKATLSEFRRYVKPLGVTRSKIDLTQVVRTVVPRVSSGLKASIELVLNSEPIWIYGDAKQLFNAFIELMRNADEAMASSRLARPPVITVLLYVEDGTTACLDFIDTGPGIPEAEKDLIFEPFHSTKGRDSGLGLPIVSDIIQNHGGNIKERGTEGEGARFVIRFPLAQDRAQ